MTPGLAVRVLALSMPALIAWRIVQGAAMGAVGGWLGRNLDGTVSALAYGVWFWSARIAAVAWTLVQSHGEPRGA